MKKFNTVLEYLETAVAFVAIVVKAGKEISKLLQKS